MKNKQLVEEIFKPSENGVSEWVSREYLDTTSLNFGKNGNIRHGPGWSDKKYVWKKRSNSRPIAFRTI